MKSVDESSFDNRVDFCSICTAFSFSPGEDVVVVGSDATASLLSRFSNANRNDS